MQLSMNTFNQEEIKNSWAFAVCPSTPRRGKLLSRSARNNAYISACSRQARLLGVREGMRYNEAKEILPEMKVLVIGKR
jgi:hypothetical protein